MPEQSTRSPLARPSAPPRIDWRSGYLPLIIGGIGAMGSALLMPWVTVATPFVGQVTRRGLDTSTGRLLGLGVLILALVARVEARNPSTRTLSVLLVGTLVLAMGLFFEYQDLTRLVAAIDADFAEARMGFGLYAMGLGLTTTLAGVLKRRILLHSA